MVDGEIIFCLGFGTQTVMGIGVLQDWSLVRAGHVTGGKWFGGQMQTCIILLLSLFWY